VLQKPGQVNMRASIAGLAQLVEHLICNQGVVGSSPIAGTILTRVQPLGVMILRNISSCLREPLCYAP
jgi:hypothetical protein